MPPLPTDASSGTAPDPDPAYAAFLIRFEACFHERVKGERRLFATSSAGLWDLYLGAIPEGERRSHDCACCKRFVERHGCLVTIDAQGKTRSPFWSHEAAAAAPVELRASIAALRKAVERGEILDVFVTEEACWGKPTTGPWSHYAVATAPPELRLAPGVATASQKSAAYRESRRTLLEALQKLGKDELKRARALLRAAVLEHPERFVGIVDWLLERHEEFVDEKRGPNRLWRAVAEAPAGWCQPRSSMVGALLEDLEQGLPMPEVRRRFNEKLHPLKYQRPQAAPTEGNIRQAEAIIAKLGLAPSLERRWARLDEVTAFWRPSAPKPSGRGVFGHLEAKAKHKGAVQDLGLRPAPMTWVKFRDRVLPTADRLELLVPERGGFCALVTATHADAPPIMQWDDPGRRNPVNLYVYANGSEASQWGLRASTHAAVLALAEKPCHWHSEGFQHQGRGVLFMLEGARDARNPGLALFPVNLRAELHGIRATVEAHSASRQLEAVPAGVALAQGLLGEPGRPWNLEVVVTTGETRTPYTIDRWD